jgi:GT2 family glycosyltransferase
MIRPVHVVVVAFHAPEQLDHCLERLGAGPATVVDNSSSWDVRAVANRRGVSYVDPGTNLGFAAGVNFALGGLLAGPPVDPLLLNPDAILDRTQLGELSRFLHRPGNERLAAVAPRLRGADGSEQRVVWPFPSPLRCWGEAIGLGALPAQETFLIGATLLLRWEALREVGVFDERFFLYAEEADWQRRAVAAGWRSAVVEHVHGVHAGAGSSTDTARREALFHAAQETYIRKWYGGLGWLSYRLAACIGALTRTAVLTGKRRSEAARRMLLYLRGPRRCAGLTGSR